MEAPIAIAQPRRRRFYTGIDDADYTAREREFMNALDAYKREHRRPFPTSSEVLTVLLSLGYRKESTS